MTFDPVRKEELRIMGFSEVAHDGSNPLERMAKIISPGVGEVDVTVGRVACAENDYYVEYADGTTCVMSPAQFSAVGVLMPPEPTPATDEPVPLAEPAGLLQREKPISEDVPVDQLAADGDTIVGPPE